LSGEAGGLLDLHRAIDHRERLALAHPVAGIDEDADDLPALTHRGDRHLASSRDRTGAGDLAGDRRAARRVDADHRDLRARAGIHGILAA
jgi:hypothetical protein